MSLMKSCFIMVRFCYPGALKSPCFNSSLILQLGSFLMAVVEEKSAKAKGEMEDVKKLTDILKPHLDVLALISGIFFFIIP